MGPTRSRGAQLGQNCGLARGGCIVGRLSVELGGGHAVQDNWNNAAQGVALAVSANAQPAPAPSAITRTVISATKLPTVIDGPLYFRAVSVTLPSGERSTASVGNSIMYQVSGSTEVSVGGVTRVLSAGEGSFIAGGTTAEVTAGSDAPSTFLHFVLARATDLGSGCRAGTCRPDGVIPHSGTRFPT